VFSQDLTAQQLQAAGMGREQALANVYLRRTFGPELSLIGFLGCCEANQ
jgi:hypothetical protein